jgi:hypothetical protein
MNRYLAAGMVSAALCTWPFSTFAGGSLNLGGGGGGETETISVTDIQAACKADPTSCGIELSDLISSGDVLFGETEPNNHNVSADPLTASVPITGQLYSAEDEDWYFIQATEINTNITILIPTPASNWHVSLRDTQGNILAARDTVVGEDFAYLTTSAYAGTHYIVIEPIPGGYSDAVYQVSVEVASSGNTTTQPNNNYQDVELEPNGLFSTAAPLASDVIMKGQLMHGGDLDMFRIDSPGNEILHIELCPEGTSCNTGGTWAMYVFSGNLADDAQIETPITVNYLDDSYGEADGEEFSQVMTFTSDHPYWLIETGGFDESMIGSHDPHWGTRTDLEIAIRDAGSVFIGVMPILMRDEDPDVLIQEVIEKKPDKLKIVVEDFQDDQYNFRITRTALIPSSAESMSAELNRVRAHYNSATGSLYIPEIKVDGEIFDAQLRRTPNTNTFSLESAAPVANPVGTQ